MHYLKAKKEARAKEKVTTPMQVHLLSSSRVTVSFAASQDIVEPTVGTKLVVHPAGNRPARANKGKTVSRGSAESVDSVELKDTKKLTVGRRRRKNTSQSELRRRMESVSAWKP